MSNMEKKEREGTKITGHPFIWKITGHPLTRYYMLPIDREHNKEKIGETLHLFIINFIFSDL